MERRRDRDLNAARLGAARIDPAVALDLGGRATNSPSLPRSFWRLSRTLFGQPNRLCRSRRACRRKASLAVGKGCRKDKSESFGERVWWLVGELTHVFQDRELRHEPIGLSADVKRDDPAVFLYPRGCWGCRHAILFAPFRGGKRSDRRLVRWDLPRRKIGANGYLGTIWSTNAKMKNL